MAAHTADEGARWSGAARLEPGVLSFTGRLGGTAAHAHAAVQILAVTSGAVVLVDRDGQRRRATAAVIPAAVRHAVEVTGRAYGTTHYLDPAGRAASAATARVRAAGDPHQVSSWVAAAPFPVAPDPSPGSRRAELHPAVAALVNSASPPPAGPPPLDAVPSLTEAAAAVGLSATRLRHLFTEQLGLPYTAWRRWVRLQRAMAAVQRGATLTRAAHEAGFTDSAHLTRVCRAMFGITPTHALHATGWRDFSQP
ncbi:helix-turn-helix transcriptional regulator [Actinomadura kijaniata]|uniref:helix-turn-helix transcriptional regulator n=1 Tax=Actinomadura kijaniata TaxID=46161 RepID=UPI000835E834|nr:helix-turn-helix transcriptional regulator [Actinomadura kijaniata]